ncbi:uncharacterized protein LOC132639434 [Lycium barbarum]|uniref:uncharacterized protein LOC132639434 n=1 Tax=Lycium barbarum TaxID=112863 RepID=UPI00293E56FB|nr:uncharacterized protein LOC132639434 [Lycium barbarum]
MGRIYRYVGEHTYGVEHIRSVHKHASSHVIASVLMNDYTENKGPSTKEIQRTVFRELHYKPSYWKCWKASIIAKNWVRGTLEHGYGCLPAYSYMVKSLNPGSRICIRLSDANRFLYYFVSYAACIRGYTHMRKFIVIDGTLLYDKYKGVLLSVVAQDTENHVYPIAFCVVDKERDDSWTYFFQQLKFIIADEPDFCIISHRHESIANGISRTYKHAHHELCMKHLSENLRKNVQCGDSLHAYFNAQFKDTSPEAAQCLEFEIGFEKWSRAHFPANRQRCADIGNSNNIFVPSIEITLREKMTESDSLFVSNINGDADEFTVIGSGRTAKVNLLNKTCSCREYDLVKLPCAHAMAALRLKYGNGYGSSIYKYSLPMYKVQSNILAFAETINVVPPESEWFVPEEYTKMYIAPPPYEPKLRRKRIKRILGITESFNPRGREDGGCDYFKFIEPHPDRVAKKSQKSPGGSNSAQSRFIPKFEMQQRLSEAEEQRDHLIVQLRDTEIEKDELKQKLMVAKEQRDQLLCASLAMLCLLFGNV